MSRLGNKPIKLPQGVKVTSNNGNVQVEGSKGKLMRTLPSNIEIKTEGEWLTFVRTGEDGQSRANHGLVRAVVNNMVKGVSEGFEKTLECIGVGYRMQVQGNKLTLNMGFSHPVEMQMPEGIAGKVQNQTELTLSGIDKELLGAFADKVRNVRPPEPYKGKGIRYKGEHIQMKEGKAAGK